MKKLIYTMAMVIACGLMSCQHSRNYEDNGMTKVLIETNKGDIVVELYNETPKHRDNFIKLVNDGTYEGTLFHRVIKNFMIQAGDPDSKTATKGQMLGNGDMGYTIPAEFEAYPQRFHKRGALAAARQGDDVNPEKASSGCQFYIVTGNVYNDTTLTNMEARINYNMLNEAFQSRAMERIDEIRKMNAAGDKAGLQAMQDTLLAQAQRDIADKPEFKFTDEQKQAYTTIGGTPHLDGSYTVFGEVIDGMDVVDEIQEVETDGNDRPDKDVVIKKMTVLENK